MNNRGKYIKASSMVEPSADFASKVLKEAEKMNTAKKKSFRPIYTGARRLLPVAASFILIFVLAAGAYAADFAGFRTTVNSWLYGEATQIQVERIGEYEYRITYPDGRVRGTGGAVGDGRGGMRAATPEEIIERINNEVEVVENEDGHLILYYHDHVEDITDILDQNNTARIQFKDGALPTYITLRWQGDGGYAYNIGHFGFEKID